MHAIVAPIAFVVAGIGIGALLHVIELGRRRAVWRELIRRGFEVNEHPGSRLQTLVWRALGGSPGRWWTEWARSGARVPLAEGVLWVAIRDDVFILEHLWARRRCGMFYHVAIGTVPRQALAEAFHGRANALMRGEAERAAPTARTTPCHHGHVRPGRTRTWRGRLHARKVPQLLRILECQRTLRTGPPASDQWH